MFNSRLFNFHDVLVIAALAITWHYLATPLYDYFDRKNAA